VTTFEMRQPCPACGGPYGRVETRNGQACVFCSTPGCGRWCYNAPRTETGERQRSMSTVHAGIKPKTRARVLLRAGSRCELCGIGADLTYLHVGHLISVKQGMAEGLSDAEINHQENLAALCESCNEGMGDESVPLRMMLRIVALRIGIRRATA
jgi:5-methylcytosine-specific restriction endonuclease McrA